MLYTVFMKPSIFTQIIRGEVPCHKIYEDDKTITFMPLHPIALGHVLVVPKVQVGAFYDLPSDDAHALMDTVQKVGKHMKNILQTKKIGIKVVGLDVDHVHFHLVAFDTLAQYNQNEDMSAEPDHPALAQMAQKLSML